ncbi:MAG: hypothetical protein Ct9H300mP8_02810 [Gammaproteobacteria bacterium]|nr:MAG: hypothetical protein Ct9H300mP8_02810 [Gammaproteobacteria bacterium]
MPPNSSATPKLKGNGLGMANMQVAPSAREETVSPRPSRGAFIKVSTYPVTYEVTQVSGHGLFYCIDQTTVLAHSPGLRTRFVRPHGPNPQWRAGKSNWAPP